VSKNFVIIGAGQAGAWVARTLRAEGFAGRVVLIGAEPHDPYERPPLSKAVLKGDAKIDSTTLLSKAQADAASIECRLGVEVVDIDRAGRNIRCADGGTLAYDKLFLTTGSRVRQWPGIAASPRIHTLRGHDDAARLRQALRGHLLVLGGGWIGLEVAATARALGVAVTLVEAAPRLCARSLPPVASAFLAQLHRTNGVDVKLGQSVNILATHGDFVTAELADGSSIRADNALVAIGILPNVELAQACGLAVEDGILVDASGRTSDPDIFAAGDVTRHMNVFAGGLVRLESWANAQNQAITAARAALGIEARYDEIPWFWSDQYGVNLQILGMPAAAARCYARGAPADGKGSWLGLHEDGRPAGAIAVNAPRDLRALRPLFENNSAPDIPAWESGAATLMPTALV
jgi:3-phenylpropionate/trans-cinnamate dioxygenase ferredoxin reductase subunit